MSLQRLNIDWNVFMTYKSAFHVILILMSSNYLVLFDERNTNIFPNLIWDLQAINKYFSVLYNSPFSLFLDLNSDD